MEAKAYDQNKNEETEASDTAWMKIFNSRTSTLYTT